MSYVSVGGYSKYHGVCTAIAYSGVVALWGWVSCLVVVRRVFFFAVAVVVAVGERKQARAER